mmetsp:Transcript_16460/g.36851  ORF Transcript_16460/g.36851 Transcript_16460/m.36851 type:complete len:268 (-) Transcript_16460:36-839(-)
MYGAQPATASPLPTSSPSAAGGTRFPNLGAELIMIRFRSSGGWLGLTPSSMLAKYPAYRTWLGIVRLATGILLHRAMYSRAELTSLKPASPVQQRNAARTVDVLPRPVRQWRTATFLGSARSQLSTLMRSLRRRPSGGLGLPGNLYTRTWSSRTDASYSTSLRFQTMYLPPCLFRRRWDTAASFRSAVTSPSSVLCEWGWLSVTMRSVTYTTSASRRASTSRGRETSRRYGPPPPAKRLGAFAWMRICSFSRVIFVSSTMWRVDSWI